MGVVEYENQLSSEDFMRVKIITERGQVVDFVVQHETIIDGRTYPVVRYDGSHGQAHRDRLDTRGRVVSKHWFQVGYAEALALGIQDIRANWSRYREDFIRRLP